MSSPPFLDWRGKTLLAANRSAEHFEDEQSGTCANCSSWKNSRILASRRHKAEAYFCRRSIFLQELNHTLSRISRRAPLRPTRPFELLDTERTNDCFACPEKVRARAFASDTAAADARAFDEKDERIGHQIRLRRAGGLTQSPASTVAADNNLQLPCWDDPPQSTRPRR